MLIRPIAIPHNAGVHGPLIGRLLAYAQHMTNRIHQSGQLADRDGGLNASCCHASWHKVWTTSDPIAISEHDRFLLIRDFRACFAGFQPHPSAKVVFRITADTGTTPPQEDEAPVIHQFLFYLHKTPCFGLNRPERDKPAPCSQLSQHALDMLAAHCPAAA